MVPFVLEHYGGFGTSAVNMIMSLLAKGYARHMSLPLSETRNHAHRPAHLDRVPCLRGGSPPIRHTVAGVGGAWGGCSMP